MEKTLHFTYHITTYGCQMNERRFFHHWLVFWTKWACDRADFEILPTCFYTTPAAFGSMPKIAFSAMSAR